MNKLIFLQILILFCNNLIAQDNNIEKNVENLMLNIGISEYLQATNQYELQNINPQFEIEYQRKYDKIKSLFLINTEKYFLSKYSINELKEINSFYNSKTGNKNQINSLEWFKKLNEAKDIFSEDFLNVLSDLELGKYKE